MVRQILSILPLVAGVAHAGYREQATLFRAEELDAASMARRLDAQWKTVTPEALDSVKLEVLLEKRQCDSAVAASQARLVALRERKAAMLRLADVNDLIKSLDRKEESLAKVRQDAVQSLQNVAVKGIYAVILSHPALDKESKRFLQGRAFSALSAQAIPDLRGVFLSSSTEIRNSQLIKDQILMESSGELSLEEEWLSHPLRGQRKFIYLAKVQVRPLAHGQTGTKDVTRGTIAGTVLDVSEGLSDSALRAHDLFEVDLERFRNALPPDYVQDLRNERIKAAEQGRMIEENCRLQQGRIQRDMQEIRSKLEGYRTQIDAELDALGRESPDDLSQAFVAGCSALDAAIARELAVKVAAKESEPIAIWRKIVPSQGTPSEDIARDVVGMTAQLAQSYGRVEKFLQVAEVQNSMLVREETLAWRDLNRRVDRVEVLLVPRDDNDYHVSIVAHFKMEGKGILPVAAPDPMTDSVKKSQDFRRPRAFPVPVTQAPSPERKLEDKTCTACWLAGGLAVGAGVTAAVLLLTQKDEPAATATTGTTNTTSNKSTVEATW
ncbi:MAG: hypothetical protein RL318_360 [Fibrobacterota bacterium]|jgi:hypothetical protein